MRLTDDVMNNAGKGLGLYVCKRIVSELQGTIRYHSDHSRGSCFTVRLPDTLGNTCIDGIEGSPRLLRSLVCVLCLPGNLCDSLTAIIQRLGVSRIVSPETGGIEAAEGNCVIEITCQEPERSGAGRQTELLFSHVSRCLGDGLPVRARRLAEPFLESTVAPILMELAFACRLSGAARSS
mgnify:FL=1